MMKNKTLKEKIEYQLVRSRRKTIGLEVKGDGSLIVRAPLRAPMCAIEDVLRDRYEWIVKHQKKAYSRKHERDELLADLEPITMDDIRNMSEQMLKEFPPRVREFADILGVTYGRVTIRNQRTRWGSCSSKGNLNFNCLLMEAPKEVQDYVIVHELCHIIEMNHSKRFWSLVESVLPNYKQSRLWLKNEGELIMLRAFQ